VDARSSSYKVQKKQSYLLQIFIKHKSLRNDFYEVVLEQRLIVVIPFYSKQGGGHASVSSEITHRFLKLGFAVENFIR
jgi:hypothetical protein